MGRMVSGSTAMVWQSKRRSLGYIHNLTKSYSTYFSPWEHLILIQFSGTASSLSRYYYMSIICSSTNKEENIQINVLTQSTFSGVSMNALHPKTQGFMGKVRLSQSSCIISVRYYRSWKDTSALCSESLWYWVSLANSNPPDSKPLSGWNPVSILIFFLLLTLINV